MIAQLEAQDALDLLINREPQKLPSVSSIEKISVDELLATSKSIEALNKKLVSALDVAEANGMNMPVVEPASALRRDLDKLIRAIRIRKNQEDDIDDDESDEEEEDEDEVERKRNEKHERARLDIETSQRLPERLAMLLERVKMATMRFSPNDRLTQ